MRWLIGIAALAATLALPAPAGATPSCDPEPVCHEFDWAQPYYEAFERHGIGYLAREVGVPVINEASRVCKGKTSLDDIRNTGNHWQGGRMLTNAEVDKVIAAANDVCPAVLR